MATGTNSSLDSVREKPPRRRRWIPVSLQFVVVLLLIFGVACAWRCVSGYRQLLAMQAMERRGASVEWRGGFDPPGPKWLLDRLDFEQRRIFDEVIGLTCYSQTNDLMLRQIGRLTSLKELKLHNKQVTDPRLGEEEEMANLTATQLVRMQVTDAGLAYIKGLTNLEKLSLENTEVTDAGLANLKNLTSLKSLDLAKTQVTDAGLVHLKGLAKLEWLVLSNTKVTDAGLANLKGMASLEYLFLDNTHVNGAGFAQLTGLTNLKFVWLESSTVTDEGLAGVSRAVGLKELDLSETRVSDAGLAHLATLTRLRELSLDNTQVTDAGLVHLGELSSLRELSLDGTQVTDSGLAHLAGMPSLESLRIHNTPVTEAGIAKLNVSLPDLSAMRHLITGRRRPGHAADFAVGDRAIAVMEGESTVDGQPALHVFRGDIFTIMQIDGDLRLIAHPNRTSAWVDVKLLATPDDACMRFFDWVESEPDQPKPLIDLGRRLRNTGDSRGSVDMLSIAIELEPDAALAYFERGVTNFRLEKADDAIADLSKAAELDENLAAEALTVRAAVFEMKRDTPAAIAGCTAAIEKDPRFARAWFLRGNMYLSTGETEKGLSDLKRCAELNPRDIDVFPALARAVKDTAPQEAADYLDQHTKLAPIDVEALHELANLRRELGQYDKALVAFDRLIELAPRRASAHRDRRLTQIMRKQPKAALEDARR